MALAKWHEFFLRSYMQEDQMSGSSKSVTAEGKVTTPSLEGNIYSLFSNTLLQQLLQQIEKNEVLNFILCCDLPTIQERFMRTDVKVQQINLTHAPEQKRISQNTTDMQMFHGVDECTSVELLGHCIAAYSQTLHPSHWNHLTSTIFTESVSWISTVFRFPTSVGEFHDDNEDGLVTLCRALILKQFPNFDNCGFEELHPCKPIIYIRESSLELGQFVCNQIGLPLTCLCVVPFNTKFDDSEAIDCDSLRQLIAVDKANKNTPLLVIAYAGTPALGHTDNLLGLHEICQEHGVWLHVHGSHLALLGLLDVPSNIAAATVCDSMTLNLSGWLNVAGAPYLTLYRSELLLHACVEEHCNRIPSYISLWLSLQHLGHDGIAARIEHSRKLSRTLTERIKMIPEVITLKSPPKQRIEKDMTTVGSIFSIQGMLQRFLDTFIVRDTINPAVVFRHCGYQGCSLVVPTVDKSRGSVANEKTFSSDKHDTESGRVFTDSINVWLSQQLNEHEKYLHIKTVTVTDQGTWLRFCPYDSNQRTHEISVDDVVQLVEYLQQLLPTVCDLITMHSVLATVVSMYKNIRVVDRLSSAEWHGIGAVRYMPDAWLDPISTVSVSAIYYVNNLNRRLFMTVSENFKMLSLDEPLDRMSCIILGSITDHTTLHNVVQAISDVGQHIEDLQVSVD